MNFVYKTSQFKIAFGQKFSTDFQMLEAHFTTSSEYSKENKLSTIEYLENFYKIGHPKSHNNLEGELVTPSLVHIRV